MSTLKPRQRSPTRWTGHDHYPCSWAGIRDGVSWPVPELFPELRASHCSLLLTKSQFWRPKAAKSKDGGPPFSLPPSFPCISEKQQLLLLSSLQNLSLGMTQQGGPLSWRPPRPERHSVWRGPWGKHSHFPDALREVRGS